MSALPSIKAQALSEGDQQHLIKAYKAIEQSQAVIEFDLDGTILTANTNFLTLFGYTLEDLVGKPHASFVLPVLPIAKNIRTYGRICVRENIPAAISAALRPMGMIYTFAPVISPCWIAVISRARSLK